jgi:aminopeptidase N
MRYHLAALLLFCAITVPSASRGQSSFTRADSLRGGLTPLRTCYDVTFYDLSITVDTVSRSIAGSNTITFIVKNEFDLMQVDLFENMKIDRIIFDGRTTLRFERELNAVYVHFPQTLKANKIHSITIYYAGTPQEAKRPPWEGGFTWARDAENNHWIAVTCQGLGASSWWPNKDHQSDEPDSMRMSVAVPSNLMNVSNGRLRKKEELDHGLTRYVWFVSYPINNYNVTLNIAKYAHFSDIHLSGKDTLTLDYYVLPEHLAKAQRQVEQVTPMMKCFEQHFGPYPFLRDGYKLVECPHTGMEHQSAVAYGNHYVGGYRGFASSEVGLMFDFIIIHETAHEWWGNSVTSNDIADMWIHESFGAYAEAVYVECMFGYDKAMQYVNGKKTGVLNDRPIIGTYGVHKAGSGDMYNKGQLVLNTLRHAIDNDSLWWDILKSIAQRYKYTSIDAKEIIALVNEKTKADYAYFFSQYLSHTNPPRLEAVLRRKGPKTEVRYRWLADVEDFRMPVTVKAGEGRFIVLQPTTSWQSLHLDYADPRDFVHVENQFYIDFKKTITYVDPDKQE